MDKIYKAAMIVIGNEILSGRTQDKNINYIANKMVSCGVVLSEVRIVPDIEETIIDTIHDLKDKVDYVFTSGGIGPTHDDITSESVAKAFDVPLETNEEAYQILLDFYGEKDFTEPRQKMAKTPKGAELIPNPVSAAPGYKIENVYVMAGIPSILQAMADHIAVNLQGGAIIHSCTVPSRFPESVIAPGLSDIQAKFDVIDIGSYPYFKDGELGVNVVLRSSNETLLSQAVMDVEILISALEDQNHE